MPAKNNFQPAAAKDKPVSHVRVGGVRIPIWRNETEGKIYHRAGLPELSYKGPDGEWMDAKSYNARDLVNLMKAAGLAHSEILIKDRDALRGAGAAMDGENAEDAEE